MNHLKQDGNYPILYLGGNRFTNCNRFKFKRRRERNRAMLGDTCGLQVYLNSLKNF
jgi:hypothetical protein